MSREVDFDGRIVIGTDGTDKSTSAERWGAGYAANRGLGLTVLLVHAGLEAATPRFGLDTGLFATIANAAQDRLDQVCERLRNEFPGLDVRGRTESGAPARALVDASELAEAVVLGTRGHGAIGRALLGSVSDMVVTHGLGRIIVVPQGDHPLSGPVVLGVDGSRNCRVAARFAFETAAHWGEPLTVVNGWEQALTFTAAPVAAAYERGQAPHPGQDADIHHSIDDLVAEFPQIHVTLQAIAEPPVRALAAATAGAGLVVVGSRGRGGFRGLLLGSTSREVVQLSTCPTAVVRDIGR